MVIEAVLGWLIDTGRNALASALPETAPPDVGDLSGFVQWYEWANTWLPLEEAFADIGIALLLVLSLAAAQGLVWVLQRAHVLG